MTSRLSLALRPDVVRRSLGYALGVGVVLISINHGDAILRGDIDGSRWVKMALTAMVPYCVSTFSSVSAMRHQEAHEQTPAGS